VEISANYAKGSLSERVRGKGLIQVHLANGCYLTSGFPLWLSPLQCIPATHSNRMLFRPKRFMLNHKICLLSQGTTHSRTTTTTTVLRPFFRDHPGEPVPEENFWTLWCKGRLTEADTPTIRLGATPSGLTSAHLHHPSIFFTGRMPFLPPNRQC